MQISFETQKEKDDTISVLQTYLLRARQAFESVALKRSWRDSEKAMARADLLKRIRVLETLERAASVTPVEPKLPNPADLSFSDAMAYPDRGTPEEQRSFLAAKARRGGK